MEIDVKQCLVVVDHPDAREGTALITGVKMIKNPDDSHYHPCFELTYEDDEIDYIRIEDQRFLDLFDIRLTPNMQLSRTDLGKLVPYAEGGQA